MLSLKIALRYLVARKSHSAVNVITIISVAGVAVATAAMVVVLSIFNGFSDLAADHLSKLDPVLKIERRDGRVIANADSLAKAIAKRGDIKAAYPVVSERALMVTETAQMPVVFSGIPADCDETVRLDSIMIDGEYAAESTVGVPAAQIAVGVANTLLLRPDGAYNVDLYVPRRTGRINPANPGAAFRGAEVAVSGVYQVDQPDIDADGVLIPLSVARDLLGYETEGTSVDVYPAGSADTDKVKKALETQTGRDYTVKTRLEQRSEAFRMISVEKWVTFMMLIFVLVIALFNIVSTLSLLVIEKRDNMSTLRAMGATRAMVRGVFITEGWLITVTGGTGGLALGVALTLIQQFGKVIRLSGDPAVLTVTTYPVRLDALDLIIVFAAILVTGFLTAQITRLFLKNE